MNRGAVAGVAADVRSGSSADIAVSICDVRFAPESGLKSDVAQLPIWATNGHRSDTTYDVWSAVAQRWVKLTNGASLGSN
jgi:hypothetical protein